MRTILLIFLLVSVAYAQEEPKAPAATRTPPMAPKAPLAPKAGMAPKTMTSPSPSSKTKTVEIPVPVKHDTTLYICEFAGKGAQVNMSFVKVIDSMATQYDTYRITPLAGKTVKVEKWKLKGSDTTHMVMKQPNGNATVQDMNLLVHNSYNFKNANRFPPDFYAKISPAFFAMSNEERMALLEKLSDANPRSK